MRGESVLWIQFALRGVLNRILNETESSPSRQDSPQQVIQSLNASSEEMVEDMYAKALKEATSQLLHEVEPIVGSLSVYANEEVTDYKNSKTKRQVDRLNGFLEAIGEIRKALSPPTYREFDLAEMILGSTDVVTHDKGIELQRAGRAPFIILGDRSRLEVAFLNGLRNAAEATNLVEPHKVREPIVINWGSTDDEYWIAILDSGLGIKANSQRVFEFGTTTKPNHFGVGLPTARQALASVSGTVSISPREPVGVRFEMRWPRPRRAAQ
jgi:signal transduction histidine kinase